MSGDEYKILRDMLEDHRRAVRDMIATQAEAVHALVDRLDDNIKSQNRIFRQVANVQAQAGVLNARVTSVDRSLRDMGDQVEAIDDRLVELRPDRLAGWDGAAAILADADRVKGWDRAAMVSGRLHWVLSRSWKSLLALGGSFGGALALVLKLFGAF